jgi:hypothetical protein
MRSKITNDEDSRGRVMLSFGQIASLLSLKGPHSPDDVAILSALDTILI